MDVLVLPVDDELYAVPLSSVREVVPKPRTTVLPTGPEPVLGLINVRGEIVPLFDILALLGGGETEQTLFAAIVEGAAGPAGLAASDAPTSEVLGERVRDSERPAARGVHRQPNDRLATLLDLDALLSGPH
jgi:purine-binding chemotaxis protein CheW